MARLRRLRMGQSRRLSMGGPWCISSRGKETLIYESCDEIPRSRSLLLSTLLVALCGVILWFFRGRNLLASNCRVAVQTDLDDIQRHDWIAHDIHNIRSVCMPRSNY